MFLQGVRLNVEKSILIEGLIEKLKETFIGCDIIIDPLKTYLINYKPKDFLPLH